ncbi:hypothetical protein AAHC03_01660 [Spirometra sp. Aus1]|nr:unnamed protein product [Spirometra erinaceieuropaei]
MPVLQATGRILSRDRGKLRLDRIDHFLARARVSETSGHYSTSVRCCCRPALEDIPTPGPQYTYKFQRWRNI